MLPIAPRFLHSLLLTACLLKSGIWAFPVSSIPFPSNNTIPITTTPTPVHVTPSFVANVVGNTHTSSVGASGHATNIPIVGGPECWFCPGAKSNANATGGWALLGIYKPGTYQPFSSDLLEPVPVVIVSSDGTPEYHPSRTTNEPATKAKRDNLPTTTETEYLGKYDVLKKYVKDGTVEIGKGYAMKAKRSKTMLGVKIPEHYLLVAGYVRKMWIEEYVDGDGDCTFEDAPDVAELKRIAIVDFDAIVYDIEYEGKEIQFIERSTSADTWDRQEAFEYKYLGRIKPGLTSRIIKDKAHEVIEEMNDAGGYNKLRRNCNDFVKKLYKRLANS